MSAVLSYPTIRMNADLFSIILDRCKGIANFKLLKSKMMLVERYANSSLDVSKDYDIFTGFNDDVWIHFELDLSNQEHSKYFIKCFEFSKNKFFMSANLFFDYKKLIINPDRNRDTNINFKSFNKEFFNISLAISELSDGWKNSSERAKVFNKFIETLGLNKDLKVIANVNTIQIEKITDKFLDFDTIENLRNYRDIISKERYVLYKNRSPNSNNELDIDGISLNGFDYQYIYDYLISVLDNFEARHILMTQLYITCKLPGYYSQVRPFLDKCPVQKFKYQFTGKPKYKFKDIDDVKLINENFCFNAFSIRPKGIGGVDVVIEKRDSDDYRLEFQSNYRSEGQRIKLEKLILDLFDGQDMIDWDVIV